MNVAFYFDQVLINNRMKNNMKYSALKYFGISAFLLILLVNVSSKSFGIERTGNTKWSSTIVSQSGFQIPEFKFNEILFVDSNVSDIASFTGIKSKGIELFVLDNSRDGVHQITGNITLSTNTIQNYKCQLGSWGQSLNESGDLLIYGCSVGQGAIGRDFINEISQLTGADVAASEDVTGASKLGGNWELETLNSGGKIESSSLLINDYPEVLAVTAASITSITSDTGLSAADFITNDQTLIFGGTYTSGGGTNNLYFWIDNVYKGAITVSANQTNVAWTYNYTATTLSNGTHTIVINTSNTLIATGQLATKHQCSIKSGWYNC
jgi:hypothetical protein